MIETQTQLLKRIAESLEGINSDLDTITECQKHNADLSLTLDKLVEKMNLLIDCVYESN